MNLTIRLFSAFCLALVVSVGICAQSGRIQPTPTPDDDTERVVTEEIKLNVLAFDDRGGFYNGVTATDVVIVENDVIHQPTSVRRIPANVLIVMDTGGELRVAKSIDKTRQVADAVVAGLRRGDSVSILQFADKPHLLLEWSEDRVQQSAAIKRANFGRRSAFIEALRFATDYLQKSGLDNKHLVLITDGVDSSGRSSAKFEALRRLESSDISVHVLSYTAIESVAFEPRTKMLTTQIPPKAMPDEIQATLPSGVRDKGVKIGPTINLDRSMIRRMRNHKADLATSQEQLEKLSFSTNGEFILPDDIDEMIEKAGLVARRIDTAYVVTYMPKVSVVETRGVATRKIEITSKRPGLTLQARRTLSIATQK